MQPAKKHHGRNMSKGYCPAKRRTPKHIEPASGQMDPFQLTLIQLLTNNRADILKLRDKVKAMIEAKALAAKSFTTLQTITDEFVELLKSAQATAHWMYNPEFDSKGVPFEEACLAVLRDPDDLRDKMFSGLPTSLVRMVMGGKRIDCPICGPALQK
jgi:hypothetical protein